MGKTRIHSAKALYRQGESKDAIFDFGHKHSQSLLKLYSHFKKRIAKLGRPKVKENNPYKVSYSLGIITPEDVELANKKIMERGLDTLEEIYARNEIVIGDNKINLMPSLTEEAINTAYKRSLKLHE